MAAERPCGRRVFVRGLVLPCRIGVPAEERAVPQPVRVDLEVVVDESRPVVDEDLSTVLDYTILIRLIEEAVREPVRLVETLAERIAAGCLADPRIRHVRVGIDKPALLAEGATVGIEIERVPDAER